jgi:O-antigen ligase
LSFFLLIIIGLLYQLKERTTKQAIGTVLVVALPAFILTLSRASWFGFALGAIAIGAVLMKDRRVRIGLVTLVIAISTYAAYSGITIRFLTEYPGQTAFERLLESFSYERWRGEYYGLGRLYWMVQTPLVVVRSSPLFGVGPGQYGGGAAAALGNTRVYEKLNLPFGVYGTEGYIDNSWFALWGETGTLGIFFYLWMFVALAGVALAGWKKSHDPFIRGLCLGYFGAILGVTFQAFLATYLEVRTLALYLWMYGAFMYVLVRREKIVA